MNDTLNELRRETQMLLAEMREEHDKEQQLYRKYLVNGYHMLSQPIEKLDCLMEPILPRTGIAALVGTSDSGKSTLLRGLAMAVASRARRYLGFELNIRHGRAIYVATEDDQSAISTLMQRQIEELCTPREAFETLDFIFQTDELLTTLDQALTAKPADLVVIDAFADLYNGPMNENNRVRSFLNDFSQLAFKHSTLFIFLHHTGKRTESLTPSKHNAIGSQGFEAKMRLMMELRPDPERHNIRHLCFVKGNYLSNEYKHDSFELRFTECLNFEATGERVPFALLRERDPDREERDREKLAAKQELTRQMQQMRFQGMSYRQIADELGMKSHASIIRALKEKDER